MERQRAILTTAAEAFAERGYAGTSFNALLRALGLSKSQAYYYFEDKADLFVTACAACYEDYYAEVQALPQPTSVRQFWAMVLKLCQIGVEYQRSHPIAARLSRAIATSALGEKLGRASIDRAMSTTERHMAWITLGQKLGAVRTDLPLDLLVALSIDLSARVDVWFASRAKDASDVELEQAAHQFADLSRRLFADTRRPRRTRESRHPGPRKKGRKP